MNGVLGLLLPGLPSLFPSIIVVIQGLFLIKCPIRALLLDLTVFHTDF